MNELASKTQLRMSFFRWALFCITLILFFGMASGYVSNSGYQNLWFAALDKPALMPPGWVFGVVWPILYILLGLAAAVVIGARGARGRALALMLFVVQLILNFLWSPLFFAAHEVTFALYVIVAILVLTILTTISFARIRTTAALLMLPYILWLCFAAYLNFSIDRLNPDAEILVAPAINTQI